MKQWILEYSATYSHCKSSTVWICVTFSVDFVETPRLALLVRFGQVPIESTALPLMQRTDNTVSISILVDFCLQISWFKMILKSKMIKNMSPISTPSNFILDFTARKSLSQHDLRRCYRRHATKPGALPTMPWAQSVMCLLVFTCRLRLLRLRLFVFLVSLFFMLLLLCLHLSSKVVFGQGLQLLLEGNSRFPAPMAHGCAIV